MPFPYSLPVLDDFNRSDGALGANWSSWPSTFYSNAFLIALNEARGSASGSSAGRWSATSFAADSGAFASFGFGGGGVVGFGGVFIRADGTTDTDGYLLTYLASGNVLRIDVGGSTIASTTQVLSEGDSIGIEAIGTAIKAYYKPVAGSWSNLTALNVTSSTISHGGYAGIFSESNNNFWDDFGAGNVSGGGAPTYHGRMMMMLGM